MITRRTSFALAVHCLAACYLALVAVALPRGVHMPPLFVDPRVHFALATAGFYSAMAVVIAVVAQLATLMPKLLRNAKPGDTEAAHFVSTQCVALAFVAFWVASKG